MITHERAHWVNAVWDDPDTKSVVVSILKPIKTHLMLLQQEKALVNLGIVHDKFHLNSMVNLTNHMYIPVPFAISALPLTFDPS